MVGVPEESVGSVAGAGAVQRIPGGAAAALRPVDSQLLSQATTGVADAPEPGDGFGAALGR